MVSSKWLWIRTDNMRPCRHRCWIYFCKEIWTYPVSFFEYNSHLENSSISCGKQTNRAIETLIKWTFPFFRHQDWSMKFVSINIPFVLFLPFFAFDAICVSAFLSEFHEWNLDLWFIYRMFVVVRQVCRIDTVFVPFSLHAHDIFDIPNGNF